MRAAVRQRWASPRDLAAAFEDLAVRAVVASADGPVRSIELEDELFRFRRIMLGNQDLRAALTGEIDAERKADAARRADRRQGHCRRPAR